MILAHYEVEHTLTGVIALDTQKLKQRSGMYDTLIKQ